MSSSRSSIVNALCDKLKLINGTAPYTSNLFNNVENRTKFWDQVSDFPFVCVSANNEARDYLPGGFVWGFLVIRIRIYVNEEDTVAALEPILNDIETVLDDSIELEYSPGKRLANLKLIDIVTDDGMLAPIGVGEISLLAQYEVSAT